MHKDGLLVFCYNQVRHLYFNLSDEFDVLGSKVADFPADY